jgi:hypothetical protein
MNRFIICLVAICCTCTLTLGAATQSKPAKKSSASTPAKPKNVISQDPYIGAIAVDARSGKVLFEEHADAKGYPASVLKLMDLLIILEKIEQGQPLAPGARSRERQGVQDGRFTGLACREGKLQSGRIALRLDGSISQRCGSGAGGENRREPPRDSWK